MKRLLSGLLFCILLQPSGYAETVDFNDIYWGSLKKENKDIFFVRCDNPTLKMKILQTDDVNKANVEKALQVFNDSLSKPVYFAFVGHVDSVPDGSYVFYIQDVVKKNGFKLQFV
jgi:hypothetical protein